VPAQAVIQGVELPQSTAPEPILCSILLDTIHDLRSRFRFGGRWPTPLGLRSQQSGRIEARTGLRMMPTFPRSPRSFRTAGFPQYGWKAGLSGGAFPDRQRLKPAPGIRLLTAGLPSPFVHLRVGAVVPY